MIMIRLLKLSWRKVRKNDDIKSEKQYNKRQTKEYEGFVNNIYKKN